MVRICCFLVALLALVGASSWAKADQLGDLTQQLGADDIDTKLDAIKALGALADTRVMRVLKEFGDGVLYQTDDHRVVVARQNGDDYDIFDAVDGSALGQVKADSLDKVRINNRLRGAIEAAMGSLMLFSERREDRLAAAEDALKHPAPARIAAIDKALAVERDQAVRTAMTRALAAARLSSTDKSEQLAAIEALSGTGDPDIFSLLSEQKNTPNLDADVKRALDKALGDIAWRLKIVGLVSTLFEGLSLGSVLLLAAIGLAITFGVMGVINMAHGEMIMLGAYTTFVVQQFFRATLPPGWIDLYLVAAVPVAFLVSGGVGVLLERGIIRFLYGRPLETLLATWGVSLFLQQAVRSVFGAPNKEVSNPSWMTGGFQFLGSATITWNRLVILVFCFAVLGGLALLLRRSSFGLHMRAVTQNREMAAAMGIPTARIDALTFGLGSGIAGMAGVALSQIGNVSPNLGTIYIVDSFLVVVFGGVGSLLGTLAGAMTLGIVNKLLEPVVGAVLGKVVVLLFIILFIQKRPRGLFALKGRAAEG
jgi:urea transport system permease protein